MNYLLAFDKFKGALTADQAVEVAARKIPERDSEARIQKAPLTDGGEGFATILSNVLGGELHEVEVTGPRFNPVMGKFALVDADHIPQSAMDRMGLSKEALSGSVGFVEMASASGYECLTDDERDPWKTSSIGTGQLMQAAVAAGAQAIVLGIGGSATNDCGAGALEALGVQYYDRDLQPVTNVIPENFRLVTTVGSMSHLLDKFPPVRIACDVNNPLLGSTGASQVFGPQKGLKETDVDRMERSMHKMAIRFLGLFGKPVPEWDQHLAQPGSGAAGGIGFALLHALPNTAFVEGFALVADLLDLPSKIQSADVVITGEGRLDESSLGGKGPVGVIEMASAAPQVILLAGSIDPSIMTGLKGKYPNLKGIAISDPDWPIEKALQETSASLARALEQAIN